MKRFLRPLLTLVVVAGLGLCFTPLDATAATCQADNGATCTCPGECAAGVNWCRCDPVVY